MWLCFIPDDVGLDNSGLNNARLGLHPCLRLAAACSALRTYHEQSGSNFAPLLMHNLPHLRTAHTTVSYNTCIYPSSGPAAPAHMMYPPLLNLYLDTYLDPQVLVMFTALSLMADRLSLFGQHQGAGGAPVAGLPPAADGTVAGPGVGVGAGGWTGGCPPGSMCRASQVGMPRFCIFYVRSTQLPSVTVETLCGTVHSVLITMCRKAMSAPGININHMLFACCHCHLVNLPGTAHSQSSEPNAKNPQPSHGRTFLLPLLGPSSPCCSFLPHTDCWHGDGPCGYNLHAVRTVHVPQAQLADPKEGVSTLRRSAGTYYHGSDAGDGACGGIRADCAGSHGWLRRKLLG